MDYIAAVRNRLGEAMPFNQVRIDAGDAKEAARMARRHFKDPRHWVVWQALADGTRVVVAQSKPDKRIGPRPKKEPKQ